MNLRPLRPPVVAVWLLERLLPRSTRDAVIGDLAALLGLDPPAAAGAPQETGKLSCASPSTHP